MVLEHEPRRPRRTAATARSTRRPAARSPCSARARRASRRTAPRPAPAETPPGWAAPGSRRRSTPSRCSRRRRRAEVVVVVRDRDLHDRPLPPDRRVRVRRVRDAVLWYQYICCCSAIMSENPCAAREERDVGDHVDRRGGERRDRQHDVDRKAARVAVQRTAREEALRAHAQDRPVHTTAKSSAPVHLLDTKQPERDREHAQPDAGVARAGRAPCRRRPSCRPARTSPCPAGVAYVSAPLAIHARAQFERRFALGLVNGVPGRVGGSRRPCRRRTTRRRPRVRKREPDPRARASTRRARSRRTRAAYE